MCTIKVFFSLLCNKAATEAAALSYQSLFLMSHDWTVPLPCRFPKHDVAALERALCVPSHNRISPALELSGNRYLSSIPLGLREHSKGHAFDSISLSATARFSRGRPHCLRRFYHARTMTGRKYHYPHCWFWLSRSMPLRVEVLKACASASVAHNRKKVF